MALSIVFPAYNQQITADRMTRHAYAVHLNRNMVLPVFNSYSIANSFAVTASSGLNVTVNAGRAIIGGYYVEETSSATLQVTASTTNYVYIQVNVDSNNRATGVQYLVSTNANLESRTTMMLARVVTSSNSVTAIEDRRFSLGRMDLITFNTSTSLSFSFPNAKAVYVRGDAIGGGGGGALYTGLYYYVTGGGGGGYGKGEMFVPNATSVTVNVGAGGTGATQNGAGGGNGGNSTIEAGGVIVVYAAGGYGGYYNGNGNTPSYTRQDYSFYAVSQLSYSNAENYSAWTWQRYPNDSDRVSPTVFNRGIGMLWSPPNFYFFGANTRVLYGGGTGNCIYNGGTGSIIHSGAQSSALIWGGNGGTAGSTSPSLGGGGGGSISTSTPAQSGANGAVSGQIIVIY